MEEFEEESLVLGELVDVKRVGTVFRAVLGVQKIALEGLKVIEK